MNKSQKVVISIFIGIMLLLWIDAGSRIRRLKNDGIVITGRFVSQGKGLQDYRHDKYGTGPGYTFYVVKKRYKFWMGSEYLCPGRSRIELSGLFKVDFPVIYNPENPKENSIINTRRKADLYGVFLSDSLENIWKKYSECDF